MALDTALKHSLQGRANNPEGTLGVSKTQGLLNLYTSTDASARSAYSLGFHAGEDKVKDVAGMGVKYRDIAWAIGNVVV